MRVHQITEDQAALRQIMRLRGYSLMTNVLEDYDTDIELITLVSHYFLYLVERMLIPLSGSSMYEIMATLE